MDVPAVALEGRGADLRFPQLALEVLHLAVEGGVHRLVDVDPVQQMRPTLQVEAETDGLMPRPPGGRRPDERRQQKHDGGQCHGRKEKDSVGH